MYFGLRVVPTQVLWGPKYFGYMNPSGNLEAYNPLSGRTMGRNLQAAVQQTLGVRAKVISPGRPQANGLTDASNKIIDAASGAMRSKLMQALAVYNTLPTRTWFEPGDCTSCTTASHAFPYDTSINPTGLFKLFRVLYQVASRS